MSSEMKNEQEDKSGKAGFECCPEQFQEMLGKMSGCCADKGNLPDCAEIMSRWSDGRCGAKGTAERK